MFNTDFITVVCTRGTLVNGQPVEPGQRIRLPAHLAAEAVDVDCFAEFITPADAERARRAHREHVAAELRRIEHANGQRSLRVVRAA